MAEQFDGSINIDTKLHTVGFNAGMKQVEATAKRGMNNIASGITKGIGNAVKNIGSVILSIGKFLTGLALGFIGLIGAVAVFGDNLLNKLEKSIDVQSAYYAQLQQLRTEFYRVQAAVYSIFSTLLQAALPAIIKIVDWLVRMLEIINQVIAALLGQKTVQRVIASSVGDTADAAGKAAKNTKKMKDEARGALAAFDQIDVLMQKKDTDADAAGGAGGGGFQFEEVPIDSKWLTFAENIKAAFLNAIQIIKDAWAAFVKIWDAFWGSPFGQLARSLWQNFLETWAKIFANTWETLQKIKDAIDRVLKGISQVIIGVLTGDWRMVWEGFKNIVGGVWEAIKAMAIGALKNIQIFFEGWKNALVVILNFWLGVWKTVWTVIQAIAVGVVKTVQGAWADLANWFRNNVTEPIRRAFESAINWIRTHFDNAFSSISNIARGAFNGVIDLINGVLRRIADAINGMAAMINQFSFLTRFSLPRVSAPSIPRLATGAVIPPNAQFLAVLGDQKSGRNIEAPEGLIRQIIREEMDNAPEQKITITFAGNLASLVRELKPHIDRENTRVGKSLANT
jgi:phage-related protein